MINNPMRLIAIVIMLLSINNVYAAQTVNTNITNDWPNSRYTVHDNGTVTDTVTGLMWQQCSVGQSGSDCSTGSATAYTWQGALQLAATDTTASLSGWRLPNESELSSIVAYDRYLPSINVVAFPNTANAYYWSSSPYANGSNHAWFIDFGDGLVNRGYRYYGTRVRLVRSGQ